MIGKQTEIRIMQLFISISRLVLTLALVTTSLLPGPKQTSVAAPRAGQLTFNTSDYLAISQSASAQASEFQDSQPVSEQPMLLNPKPTRIDSSLTQPALGARHQPTPTPTPHPPLQEAMPIHPIEASCSSEDLIILATQNIVEMRRAIDKLESHGGCVVHVFPTRALIGSIPAGVTQQLMDTPEIVAVYDSWVDPKSLAAYGTEAQLAVYIWNRNFIHPVLSPTPGPGATSPRPLVGDVLLADMSSVQSLEHISLGPAPGYSQISEFMSGKVAVGIILPESNGMTDLSTEDWDASRMNQVVAEIQAAMDWWANTNPNGNLSFYYDIHYQVPTQYEPINRPASDDDLWVTETLSTLGYSGDNWVEQTFNYLNAIRSDLKTDWAVVAFVVDSLNDPDGFFTDGFFGYTYGFLIVMTYDNDGWGIDNMDSVMAHEFAHNFGAGDEYCSPGYACCWGDGQLGYLGIPNSNCEAGCDHNDNGVCDGNDTTPESDCHNCPSCIEISCLMRTGSVNAGICATSQQQVGIRDLDSDNILDPVDTIPTLGIDPWPPEYINDNTPTYVGMAEDIPYDSPTRDDVTINNITEVVFEIDYDGIWRSASADDGAFDETTESFALTTPQLAEGPHSIFIRPVNRVGNTSPWPYLYDTFTVDTVPPTATISAFPLYGDAPFLDFWVMWSGQDATTDVTTFDVQYRDGIDGDWIDWLMGTPDENVYVRFVGEDGHTYYFRVRARDWANNLGDYTDGSTSYTVQICPTPPDAYEVDDSSSSAKVITSDGISQTHAFHTEGDQDWTKFYAAANVTYTLATTNTGGHADTVLYLYDIDGSTLIASNDDYPGMWPASRLDWQPTTAGVYYIKTEHWDPWAYGCTTEYGLSITTNDEISPTGNIVINDGAVYAASRTVTLTLVISDDGTGVNQMMLANDSSFSNATWVTFTPSLEWTLEVGDGIKTIYSRFRDRAGNVSTVYSDTIFLDMTPPTGSIVINDEAIYVLSRAATLTLVANDAESGIDQIAIANDDDFSSATWMTYTPSLSWTLAAGDGIKPVYVKLRDRAGNTAVYSDTIILDTVAPTGNIIINDQDAFVAARTVTLTLEASDDGMGVDQMVVANNYDFSGATWMTYTSSLSWTLKAGSGTLIVEDGVKTVYTKFRDRVGRVSSIYSDTILLDMTPPTGSIIINNGAVYAASNILTLTLPVNDDGAGVDQMMLANDSSFSDATWMTYTPSSDWTLDAGQGTKTVHVQFRDRAGNMSAVYSDTIFVDTILPTGSVIINDEAAYVTSRAVTLTLAADDSGTNVDQMMLANDNGFGGAAWITFTPSQSWALTDKEGLKTVYARFLDRAGNPSKVYSDTITFYKPVNADFDASPRNGIAPLTVYFTDTSSGSVVAWEWVFGDGETSTLQDPVHIYRMPGEYTVSLSVRLEEEAAALPGGMDTLARTRYIIVQDYSIYLPVVLRGH